MSISIDEVRHVARLARLDLAEVEILALQGELNALLGHFADIQRIDASYWEQLAQAVTVQSVWSEDIPEGCLPRESALRNAPISKAGLFVVPSILEG
jgi:aspartyl-tRNA(Asn)/glutamyl-tRNA(Gln) amidotransferase subunit C